MRHHRQKGLSTLAVVGLIAASPFVLLYGLYGYLTFSEPALHGVVPFRVDTPQGFEMQAYRLAQPAADLEIVFVHGTPGDANAFHAQFRKPFPGATLIAVDRPGFGASDGERDVPSLEHQVKALEPLLEAASSPRLLVGHSYGGPVVLQAAIEYPTQIAAVLLIGGSVDPSLEETMGIQKFGDLWPVRQLIPGAMRVANRELMTLKSDLEKLDKRWGELSVPVGMLQGGKDKLVPPANVDYAERRLREVGKSGLLEKFVYPELNHFIPWEHPELVEKAIARMKERIVKSPHPPRP